MNTTARLSVIAALLAGAGMVSTSAMAATITGTANATVLAPIAISQTTGLSFGSFAALTGGTVTMTTAGNTRAKTGSVVLGSTTGTSGVFAVTGAGSMTFSVAAPTTFDVTHTNGTDKMTVTPALAAATGTLSLGTATVGVGGSLAVSSAQPEGVYSGTYNLTVEYN